MKKTLLLSLLFCCAFLLGSCKNPDDQALPPNENGANNTKKGQDSPDSNPDDLTKSNNTIQTGGEPSTTTNPAGGGDGGSVVAAEQSMGSDYYTIVNQSDDSHIRVSFLNSFKDLVRILLREYDCVKVTETQFQNNITSITLVDADHEDEAEPFCGADCLSFNDDCYEKCPVNNYRMLDGLFYDEIEINQPRSSRHNCVPLFQF